jgi:hypothetical protein
MPQTETFEDKIENICRIATKDKIEKINMTKDQHTVMENLVVIYMTIAASGGDKNSLATLDQFWDSIINIT